MSPCRFPLEKERPIHAFTLIELLATICIIAVLSSLLFSGFQAVRQSQKRMTCLVNLKAIGGGMNEFMNEHNGYGPPHNNGAFFDDGNNRKIKVKWHWMTHIAPYVGAPDYEGNMSRIFTCPADPNVKIWPETRPYLYDSSLDERASKITSYGYNYLVFTSAQSYPTPKPRQAIQNPSRLIIVADGGEDGAQTYINPQNSQTRSSLRHGGKFNAVFLDGHAETLGASAASDYKAYWTAKP